MDRPLIDRWGYILTLGSCLFSWILFWSYTGDPIGSLSAAVIAAGLFFLAYIVLRMLILAFRS